MVTQPYQLEEGRCMIGASVGIAIAPYDGVTSEEIVHSADIALYAAKNGGRGQFRFYSSELQSESHLRKVLAETRIPFRKQRQQFVTDAVARKGEVAVR